MATNSKQSEPTVDTTGRNAAKGASARKERKTKKDRLCTLLRRKGGVSIYTLQKELGWQSHTVRAAISGVRKTGETVECLPGKVGPTYRIVKEAAAQ